MKSSFVTLPVLLLKEPKTILLLNELSSMTAIFEATGETSGTQRKKILDAKGPSIGKKARSLLDTWLKELGEKGYVMVVIRRLMN